MFDLIARLEASVDFPDEGYHFIEPASVATAIDGILARTQALLASARRGRIVREGFHVAIVGEPNVGKSSLFNALVGSARAIVTDIPGTTRDLVTETVDLEGLRVTLIDTAGARHTEDVIEVEGVARSKQAAGAADLVLLVADQSTAWSDPGHNIRTSEYCSARAGGEQSRSPRGLASRRGHFYFRAARSGDGEAPRQRFCLRWTSTFWLTGPGSPTSAISPWFSVRTNVCSARGAPPQPMAPRSSEEFVLADLGDARSALEEITGARATDALLEHIFSRFCIGK